MSKKSDYITLRFSDNKFPATLFTGRISRSQFIFSLIGISIISYILGQGITYVHNYFKFQIIQLQHTSEANSPHWISPLLIGYGELLIIFILTIVVIILLISVFSKRFHDIGRSGYWGLIGIIPYLNAVVIILLILMKGKSGTNKYGKPPATFFI